MLARIVDWSGRNRLLVFLASLLATAAGVLAAIRSPLDAIPDLSDPQVIVFADWMGRSPQLVEDQVTYPLVTGLQALPGVKAVRGFTMFGMSFTYVLLQDDVDPYWARTRVSERLDLLGSRLPPDVELTLGPDASAVGWVYQYALVDPTHQLSVADLRSLQDWTLRFALEGVDGVAEVATVGGFEKQYQAVLDPERMRAAGIAVSDVTRALSRNNRDVGGRVLEEAGRELYLQGHGLVRDLADLDRVHVATGADGTPIALANIASVEIGPEIRRGIADLDGTGESVGGLIVARQGENALRVIDAVKARLAEVPLPDGVEIVPVYDRSELIRGSVATLFEAIAEEVVIIALLLGVFLLHGRSILVPILVLPCAIAVAFVPMYHMGLTINIMSLAGIIIAIGDMVDAVVLLVENAARRIEDATAGEPSVGTGGARAPGDGPATVRHPDEDRTEVVLAAARELGGPLVSSLLLIAVSFLPIFALEAQEGRLFTPLAWTKTLSMLAAALFTLTLAPALAVTLLRGKMPREAANPVNRGLRALYRPIVGLATRHPWPFVAVAALATVVTIPVYNGLGREFMPPLYEGSLLYMPITIPGISAEQARTLLQAQDAFLASIPEVDRVIGKAGRAETATDPAPLSMFETVITLKPRDRWRPGVSVDDIVREMEAGVTYPGVQNAFTMPIKARVDMLTTGIRTPVGVKVLGDDLGAIADAGERIEAALREVAGTRSVYAERLLAAVFVEVTPRRDDLLRYGAATDDVLDVVEMGLGGMSVGRVFDGRERYSLIARFGRDFRGDEDGIRSLPVQTGLGVVPLGELAEVKRAPGPAMLVDEGGKLAGYIYVDPGDRDLGGYVGEARQVVERLGLDPSLQVVWTGQYELLQRAQERLAVMAPLTVALVFALVFLSFRTVGETSIVLLTLPFSVLGSVWFLSVAGYDLSIATWVAMIALIGVGAEVGMVLAVYLDLGVKRALDAGERLTPARLAEVAADSAAGRMRGMVLAIAMNLFGLLPVLFSQGAGSDMARRMAGPMFGGLLTLTFMTALVLPAMWVIWRTRQLRRGTLATSLGRSRAEG